MKKKLICKCGNKVPDMKYCSDCGEINFGKRKIVVVAEVGFRKKDFNQK